MKRFSLCLLALVLLSAALPRAAAQAPATAATTRAARTVEQINQDLQATGKELMELIGPPKELMDPAKRKQVAEKAIPLFKRTLRGVEEMATVQNVPVDYVRPVRLSMLQLLALLGDAPSEAALVTAADRADQPAEAAAGKAALLTLRWWRAAQDAPAQLKLLDEARKMAKADPLNDALAHALMGMSEMGAASADLKTAAVKVVTEEIKTQTAKRIAARLEEGTKLKSLEGKPLTIEGVKVDGTRFSSAQMKGKVILVDFWATWCGPCREELPRLKKAYADFHAKGLEVVGVSCDREADDLTAFLADNKDMPWPQLFDKANPGWHALAKEYGITGIPTMFLIDKKGVVRTVEARQNYEELIPKLLAE